MVDIAGTAEGRGGVTAFILVGDEVADWALIEAVRQALSLDAHTPFADKIGTLVARREQAIRRAAQQRGRKEGGTNLSAKQWRARRQRVEEEVQNELRRRPFAYEVQQRLGLAARTEQKYRRQWGVPGAWILAEDNEEQRLSNERE